MDERARSDAGGSHASRSSRASRTTLRAEAAASLAEAKIKMKYFDLENRKKRDLCALELQRELDIAEARFQQLSENVERTLRYGEEVIVTDGEMHRLKKPQTSEEYVQDYIKNNPLLPETETPIHPVNSQGIGDHRASTKLNAEASDFVPQKQLCDISLEFANLTKSFAETINLGRLPTPEPGVFSGDPLQYQGWKCAFESLIERRGIPPSERIYFLNKYLSGDAKSAVAGYLLINTQTAFEEAKLRLDSRFGSPFHVAKAFRDKLDTWPKIEGRDGVGLRKLSDYLFQCHNAMNNIDSLKIWNDEKENSKLVEKLPEWLVYRWGRVIANWRREHKEFPSFKKFVDFISDEAEIMCDPVLVSRLSKKQRNEKPTGDSHKVFSRKTTHATAHTKQDKIVCVLCTQEHDILQCKSFAKKSMEERKDFIRQHSLCFACLRFGHRSKECYQRAKCDTCGSYHPTALHGDRLKKPQPQDKKNETEVKKSSSFAHKACGNENDKCSMIVPVLVSHEGRQSEERLVYALLDTQSDATFISKKTCDDLNVRGPDVNLKLSTMTAQDELISCEKIGGLQVRGYDSHDVIKLPTAYTRESIPANIGHIPTPDKARQWPHLEEIAEKLLPLQDIEIGLLIGYNCSRALIPREIIAPPDESQPYGQRSDLGWGIVGILDQTEVIEDNIGVSHRLLSKEVPQELNLSYQQEKVHISMRSSVKEVISPSSVLEVMEIDFHERKPCGQPMSIEDQRFMTQIQSGIRQREDKHYEMPLPFRNGEPVLPDNRSAATQRVMQLKRRLLKEEKYATEYCSFMDTLMRHGYAEKAPVYDTNNVWYVPHHGVFHPKKPDKLRVVFDCSARHQGVSLNDYLLKGPDLINTMIGVLCRFRKEKIAIQCDIEAMYHQFFVPEGHRDYLRFLWWEDDFECDPTDYRMCVHLFGATSSPGCANYGLKEVAKDYEHKYGSAAAKFIQNDFYVDDGLTSVQTVEEALDLINSAKGLCQEGGLRLHKFVSNSKEVLSSLSREDVAKDIKDIDLLNQSLPVERALGCYWCIESDMFEFRITLKDQPLVRRSVLSTINSIYDPLGLVAPVLLVGKQIMQETCKHQMDWDSPLPEELKVRWEKWRNNLFMLDGVKTPRCFKPPTFGDVETIELHHFSDASTTGYGQVSYLRMVDKEENVHCAFVTGKSRVCPMKAMTIPRLELTAAVVSVRVSQFLDRELRYDKITEVFWTDSRVVLGYIANESSRFHVFVANRVQYIRDNTEPSQWKHVPGNENPADIASRGIAADKLMNSTWFQGPNFLWKKCLPSTMDENMTLSGDDPEVKRVKSFASSASIPSKFEVVRLERFSSWQRARKVVALCLKLKQKLRKQIPKGASVIDSISVEDLQNAETVIIQLVQEEVFSSEVKLLSSRKHFNSDSRRQNEKTCKQALKNISGTSPLYKLDPFLDSKGIMRVGGRTGKATWEYELKNPVILPKKHHVTRMIIGNLHERSGHQGRGITMNDIRSRGYWILNCASEVSSVISKCVKCRRLRSPVQEQKMSNLPDDRLEQTPPFTYCGVDMFGPFYVKEGRKEMKRYGALFTCLVCRAVHIEITNSLSTDSFINALRRFIATRGPIRQLRCDQGTNFVGAEGEYFDPQHVGDYLLRQNCDYFTFKMNAPSASHAGGVWERQIRSVRSVFSGLMSAHGQQLDDEGLRTLMAEVMAIVNSRPLSVETLSDPNSVEPLTPNHLLTCKTRIILPPPGNFQREDVYSRKQWRRVQYLANEFWYRWRREYIQTLQIRQKWQKPRRVFQNGDVVLIKDENTPRALWRLARVMDTIEEDDGMVRRVTVAVGDPSLLKTGKRVGQLSHLERPIQKLVLILESEL